MIDLKSLDRMCQDLLEKAIELSKKFTWTGISGKLWATFLPAQGPSSPDANPRGISLAMRDVQTIAIYDSKGGFVGIRRPESGKPITVSIESKILSTFCIWKKVMIGLN